MRSILKASLAIACCCATPVAANPLCDRIAASFAPVLTGPVNKTAHGASGCTVSAGGIGDVSASVAVSLHPGTAATLKSMRALMSRPTGGEAALGDGAYSVLDKGGGGMLPQFTMNAQKSGKWAIIEVRRRGGFAPADLARARAGAASLMGGL